MTPKNILIVEDDATIRETLRELLMLEGYAVSSAKHGRAALDLLMHGQENPALILLDLMMPVMTGWEFLEAIKDQPQLSRIPIVVLSAASTDLLGDVKASAMLRKPIDITSLLGAIERLCV